MSVSGRRKRFGFWRISLVFLVLLLIALPVGLLMLVSGSNPLVTESARIDSNSAIKARSIAKQFYRGLKRPQSASSSSVSLSESDLNELLALAVRGIPSAKSRARIETGDLLAEITIYFPGNPFGDYLNVTAVLKPFSGGLKISELSIGDLALPGRWLLAIAETALNRALEGQTLGSELLAAVESLHFNDSWITVVYHPVPNFRDKVKQLKQQVQLGDDDSQRVRDYYLELCKFRQQATTTEKRALSSYLSHTFQYAQQLSQDNDQAVEENRAALLALALYLGSGRFDTVVGALNRDTRAQCRSAGGFIGVANRNDLRLHFVFSAALQVISNSGVSFSIGEFKELLDTEQGGSGFSFADLAADRAGIRFAEFAVDDDGASQLQNMAAQLADETVFFPTINRLPEGISQKSFEEHGGIESEFYQQYLVIIDRRINGLPLYLEP